MLETETVASAVRDGVTHHFEYTRDMGKVIGWDGGKDAHVSFAECSSRTYHGRPMSRDNHKLGGDS